MDAASITTTDVYVRESLKVLMAVLALVGITGMYLSQTRRNGVLGLVGYACCWPRATLAPAGSSCELTASGRVRAAGVRWSRHKE